MRQQHYYELHEPENLCRFPLNHKMRKCAASVSMEEENP